MMAFVLRATRQEPTIAAHRDVNHVTVIRGPSSLLELLQHPIISFVPKRKRQVPPSRPSGCVTNQDATSQGDGDPQSGVRDTQVFERRPGGLDIVSIARRTRDP